MSSRSCAASAQTCASPRALRSQRDGAQGLCDAWKDERKTNRSREYWWGHLGELQREKKGGQKERRESNHQEGQCHNGQLDGGE